MISFFKVWISILFPELKWVASHHAPPMENNFENCKDYDSSGLHYCGLMQRWKKTSETSRIDHLERLLRGEHLGRCSKTSGKMLLMT